MNNFKFDEESHTYYLDGIKIPSVSEVISPLSDFSNINAAVLENACNYGKAVHKTIELHLKDYLDEDSLSEGLKQPLEQFKRFMGNSYNTTYYTIEKPLYDSSFRFAGTPDLVSDKYIIDIKTRKYNPVTDDLQLAAYEILVGYDRTSVKGKREKYILELLPNEPFNLIRVSNRQAKSMFLYMLTYWHKTNEFNEKIKGWKKCR